MSPGRELAPISCSRAAPSAPDNADTDNEDSYNSCYWCGPSNQNIDWFGWWPTPPTRHNRRRKLPPLQTRQPLPACSRKCKHRWRINMNAMLSLLFRPEWYSLLLHASYNTYAVFLGKSSKTYLDSPLSS